MKLTAWLRLLRVPNLLTVPGDPLAGFYLASGAVVWPSVAVLEAALAAVGLYAAGLVLNDYADREVDRRERPQRPLPSGAITPGTALGAGLGLGLLGIILAFVASNRCGWVALILGSVIWAYNFRLKSHPVLGPLAMGCCRGLSLMLGAVVAEVPLGWSLPITGAVVTTFYIIAVTCIARGEMGTSQLGFERWIPGLILLVGALGLGLQGRSSTGTTLAFVPALVLSVSRAWNVNERTGLIPQLVGGWISALIWLQGAWILSGTNDPIQVVVVGGMVVTTWITNRQLSRWFYAS